jgi:hypothetical protein
MIYMLCRNRVADLFEVASMGKPRARSRASAISSKMPGPIDRIARRLRAAVDLGER